MSIQNLINNTSRPELYKKGRNQMWTDNYISKQLLDVHLNDEIDLATRKKASIQKTVTWIQEKIDKEKISILDLGCGPGIYAEEFAKRGHSVTGIDISQNSISYARDSAAKNNLDISYRNGNYLDVPLGKNKFELIILVYTDFGVLTPEERSGLLKKIRAALKPGGCFIFDILNEKSFALVKEEKDWDFQEKGFWSGQPYLHLYNSWIYKKENVILYQHIILEDPDSLKIYRFWTHFFSDENISGVLSDAGFKVDSVNRDVLPETDQWNGKYVTFVTASAE